MTDATDYEKLSYGKAAYKRVQRLRRKGERRGIHVPYLGYELTKPEKPRIAFWVVAAISALLFVGVLVFVGLMYNELVKAFSDLSGLGEFIKAVFNPDTLKISLGLSALPGIMLVVVYILVIVLFALPVIAVIYFYRFVRDAFYMAKCSKEEFAKGNVITSRIIWLIVVLIAATVLFIFLLSYMTSASVKLYAGLIFAGLVIALGGLLALMIVEKRKCSKWFESFDESKKRDYLEHENSLNRVKRRLKTERQLWDSLGK